MRYKILYGGRGGGKTWSIARALLIIGGQRKMRVLCAREFMSSISDSVHKILSDQVIELGLSDVYEVQQSTIINRLNGTQFMFTGLRHNASKLKSFEAINIVWVEEAANVSKASWDVLIPTIRADDSEIWVSFNPEFEEDETYKRFVKDPPTNAALMRINWSDNPWFPTVLHQEKDALKLRDEDAYLNVWEGHCRQVLEGSIYATELREAIQFNRITKVPYTSTQPVKVFVDLGWADATSLWFSQRVGMEYRLLRAYQNRQHPWHHYLQYIQAQGYVIEGIYLPHDARAKSLGTGKSIEEITRAAGFRVSIVPMLSVEEGINAVRTIFSNCYFDADNCDEGIYALRRYRYDVDTSTGKYSRKPLHDDASHFADALRYFAVGMTEKPPRQAPAIKTVQLSMKGNARREPTWMGR